MPGHGRQQSLLIKASHQEPTWKSHRPLVILYLYITQIAWPEPLNKVDYLSLVETPHSSSTHQRDLQSLFNKPTMNKQFFICFGRLVDSQWNGTSFSGPGISLQYSSQATFGASVNSSGITCPLTMDKGIAWRFFHWWGCLFHSHDLKLWEQ